MRFTNRVALITGSIEVRVATRPGSDNERPGGRRVSALGAVPGGPRPAVLPRPRSLPGA